MKILINNYITIILIFLQLIYLIKPYKLDFDDFEYDDDIIEVKKRDKRWAKSTSFFPKWPNAIVNYKISCTEFTNDELNLIRSALNEIENRTCVRFVHYDINDNSVRDYVDVQCIPGGRCKAQLGYLGGRQNLNLDRAVPIPKEYCVNYRKIQHEFLHSLGFKHEHNSPNRDNYIEIMWENVRRGGESYFDKDRIGNTYHYGCAYDYNSVMSVPSNRQSKNGKATIVPRDPNYTSETIGIALSISECDVIRINNMFCNDLPNQNVPSFGQQGGSFARPPIALQPNTQNGPFGLNTNVDVNSPPAGFQAPFGGQRNPNKWRQNRFNREVNENSQNNYEKLTSGKKEENFRHDPISL